MLPCLEEAHENCRVTIRKMDEVDTTMINILLAHYRARNDELKRKERVANAMISTMKN